MQTILIPFLLILSLLSCCIEVEMAVPGFPNLARYFSVSEVAVQLTLAFNLLGFALASLVYGPLSESLGRRNVMLIGNFIMLVGAYACLFAPSMQWLYLARFIQGLGAAASAVIVFAIVADIYTGEACIKLISYFNAIFTACMAIAPLLGSFINQLIGWRGNYACVAILINIAWLALLLFLPETHTHRKPLCIKTILKDYCHLLTNKHFLSASIVPSLLYAGYMAFIACSSFLYINSYQFTLTQYAYHLAGIISLFAITSIYTSKITKILGKKLAIALSLLMIVSGIVLMLTNVAYLVTVAMSLYCVGFAVLYPIIFSHSLEIFPHLKGSASSAIMSMRTLIMTVLIASSGYVYNGTSISLAGVLACSALIIFILMSHLRAMWQS